MVIQGIYLDITTAIYNKHKTPLVTKIRKHLPLNSYKKGFLLTSILIKIALEVLAIAIKHEKKVKGIKIGK